jgi:polyisoprenoid-binding protein YceI
VRALIAIAVLSTAVITAPAPATAEDSVVRGVASSRFTGSSTLHNFSGSAPAANFTVEPASNGSWTAAVEIPVAELTTENSLRDGKMRNMFHADEQPLLRAEFAGIGPDQVRTSGRLPFRLTIAGVTRDVTAAVSNWRTSDNHLDFTAEFDVSLAAFGLEAPRTFVIVVADSVHVTTEVSLRRE